MYIRKLFLFVEAEVCQDLFSPAFMDTAGAFSPLLAFTAFSSSSLFVIYLSGLRDRCSSACMKFEGGCSICSSVCLPHSLPNLLAGHSISKSFKHKQQAVNLQQPEYSMRFLEAQANFLETADPQSIWRRKKTFLLLRMRCESLR